jgi:predicted MPP superfamily phosphohydrolase
MRIWFKYALAFLAVMLVFAFFARERMTNVYPSSEPPKNPERLLTPYSHVLYTEGGN